MTWLSGRACACLFVLLFAVIPVRAAESELPALTLQQAIAAALRSNPELASFAYRLRAQEARVRQGALRPAPDVSLEMENALGTREDRDFE